MIKLIDAKDNLSVQVHPDDAYALKNERSFGKTEMWYIVEADEGAGIYLGFKEDVSEEMVEEAIKQNTLTSLMNFFEVKAGDCYFIPAGTIHAIGTGCLIYEIQQNSNLTYRVYDYDRRDKNGNPRELHVEKAMKVLDFSKYEPVVRDSELLGISKYFTAKKAVLKNEARAFPKDMVSFRCVTVTEGDGFINGTPLHLGDSYFIPAGSDFCLSGRMTAIIAEVRKYGVRAELSASGYTVTLFDDLGNSICCAIDNTEEKARQKLYKLMNISENDITL
jgi:mannose-6-phosphate isomerase